jgi:hypothetical protein
VQLAMSPGNLRGYQSKMTRVTLDR